MACTAAHLPLAPWAARSPWRAPAIGHGATFTLELPIAHASPNDMNIAPLTSQPENHRILIIDDNPSIHEDFRKILGPADATLAEELDADEAALFGDNGRRRRAPGVFKSTPLFKARRDWKKCAPLVPRAQPYAVAFVDVRMPPGWDGIETISRIWKEFPDLQIVICTAYSDYSWDEITKSVGSTDQMLVLKKPFDNVEVLQMAHALSKKWQLTQIARRQMEELDALVNQRTEELRAANARLTGEVAERTAAEEALRRSEERFSKAFQGSPGSDGDPTAGRNRMPRCQYQFSRTGWRVASRRCWPGGTTFWADEATRAKIREEFAAAMRCAIWRPPFALRR